MLPSERHGAEVIGENGGMDFLDTGGMLNIRTHVGVDRQKEGFDEPLLKQLLSTNLNIPTWRIYFVELEATG